MFAGVFRKRKSMSIVVTGAPCSAAAALPISTASSLCLASKSAMRASKGAASMHAGPLNVERPCLHAVLRLQDGEHLRGPTGRAFTVRRVSVERYREDSLGRAE